MNAMSDPFCISEATFNKGGVSVEDNSFVISLDCQDALGSQRGFLTCRDAIGTKVTRCEIRDRDDKDTLRAFAFSGSMNVSYYPKAPSTQDPLIYISVRVLSRTLLKHNTTKGLWLHDRSRLAS